MRLAAIAGEGPTSSAGAANLGRELYDHPTIGGARFRVLTGVVFGIPCLAMGVRLLEPALRSGGFEHPANWLPTLAGGIFAVIGVSLCALGLREVIRRLRYHYGAATKPHQVWLYDHHWRADGAAFSAFDTMLGRLAAALACSALVVPAVWLAFGRPQRGVALLFTGIALVPTALLWRRWLVSLRDYRRYGKSFLRYGTFPFFLGDTLHAALRPPTHVADMSALTLTLRCVQQRFVRRPRGTVLASYELYSHATTIPHDRLIAAASTDIPVEFPLPADQLTTCFAKTPQTYWEIEASGQAQGGAYNAYFLVPVYAPAGAPTAV